MPAPFALQLQPEQTAELEHLRDHDATPYVRERSAAILKVAAGQSLRAVGCYDHGGGRRWPPGCAAT